MSYSTLIALMAGLLVGALVINYLGFNQVMEKIENIRTDNVMFYLFLSVVILLLDFYRLNIILGINKIDIGYVNVILYRTAGYAINCITPLAQTGGEPFVAYLISKRHNIAFNRAFAIVSLDRTLEFLAQVVFILVASVFITVTYSERNHAFFRLVTVLSLLAIVIVTAVLYILSKKPFISQEAKTSTDIYRRAIREIVSLLKFVHITIINAREIVTLLGVVILTKYLLQIFQYYFLVATTITQPSLPHLAISVITVSISYAIPIPGAIGSMTAISSLGFGVINRPAEGATISFIVQLKDLLITLAGFVVIGYLGAYGIVGRFVQRRTGGDDSLSGE